MTPQTLMTLRRYHSWLGVFFAPFILLFSVSGALQTFRLQEEKGYGGTPPTWIVWLAAVHKDQTPPRAAKPNAAPKRDAKPPVADDDHDHDHDHAAPAGAKQPSPLPLKIFVVLMALALIASTLIGLTIAFANRARRRPYMVALVLGAVLPCVLLWI